MVPVSATCATTSCFWSKWMALKLTGVKDLLCFCWSCTMKSLSCMLVERKNILERRSYFFKPCCVRCRKPCWRRNWPTWHLMARICSNTNTIIHPFLCLILELGYGVCHDGSGRMSQILIEGQYLSVPTVLDGSTLGWVFLRKQVLNIDGREQHELLWT